MFTLNSQILLKKPLYNASNGQQSVKIFKLIQSISKTQSQEIWNTVDPETNQQLTLKIIKKNQLLNKQKAINQIKNQQLFNGKKNFINLYEIYQDTQNIYLVIQKWGTTLAELIKKRYILTQYETQLIFSQLVDIVTELRTKNIAHNAITLESLYVDINQKHKIKLGDFSRSFNIGWYFESLIPSDQMNSTNQSTNQLNQIQRKIKQFGKNNTYSNVDYGFSIYPNFKYNQNTNGSTKQNQTNSNNPNLSNNINNLKRFLLYLSPEEQVPKPRSSPLLSTPATNSNTQPSNLDFNSFLNILYQNDIWNIGIILYRLLIGRFPFNHNDEDDRLYSTEQDMIESFYDRQNQDYQDNSQRQRLIERDINNQEFNRRLCIYNFNYNQFNLTQSILYNSHSNVYVNHNTSNVPFVTCEPISYQFKQLIKSILRPQSFRIKLKELINHPLKLQNYYNIDDNVNFDDPLPPMFIKNNLLRFKPLKPLKEYLNYGLIRMIEKNYHENNSQGNVNKKISQNSTNNIQKEQYQQKYEINGYRKKNNKKRNSMDEIDQSESNNGQQYLSTKNVNSNKNSIKNTIKYLITDQSNFTTFSLYNENIQNSHLSLGLQQQSYVENNFIDGFNPQKYEFMWNLNFLSEISNSSQSSHDIQSDEGSNHNIDSIISSTKSKQNYQNIYENYDEFQSNIDNQKDNQKSSNLQQILMNNQDKFKKNKIKQEEFESQLNWEKENKGSKHAFMSTDSNKGQIILPNQKIIPNKTFTIRSVNNTIHQSSQLQLKKNNFSVYKQSEDEPIKNHFSRHYSTKPQNYLISNSKKQIDDISQSAIFTKNVKSLKNSTTILNGNNASRRLIKIKDRTPLNYKKSIEENYQKNSYNHKNTFSNNLKSQNETQSQSIETNSKKDNPLSKFITQSLILEKYLQPLPFLIIEPQFILQYKYKSQQKILGYVVNNAIGVIFQNQSLHIIGCSENDFKIIEETQLLQNNSLSNIIADQLKNIQKNNSANQISSNKFENSNSQSLYQHHQANNFMNKKRKLSVFNKNVQTEKFEKLHYVYCSFLKFFGKRMVMSSYSQWIVRFWKQGKIFIFLTNKGCWQVTFQGKKTSKFYIVDQNQLVWCKGTLINNDMVNEVRKIIIQKRDQLIRQRYYQFNQDFS